MVVSDYGMVYHFFYSINPVRLEQPRNLSYMTFDDISRLFAINTSTIILWKTYPSQSRLIFVRRHILKVYTYIYKYIHIFIYLWISTYMAHLSTGSF